MKFAKKIFFIFFIIFSFAPSIQALLPIHRFPGDFSAFIKEPACDILFKNSWAGCQTSTNLWNDPNASMMQNCAFETHINCNETIIKLTINTALLATIIALGIAYKIGYFEKIKKYFNPCDDSDELSNNKQS